VSLIRGWYTYLLHSRSNSLNVVSNGMLQNYHFHMPINCHLRESNVLQTAMLQQLTISLTSLQLHCYKLRRRSTCCEILSDCSRRARSLTSSSYFLTHTAVTADNLRSCSHRNDEIMTLENIYAVSFMPTKSPKIYDFEYHQVV